VAEVLRRRKKQLAVLQQELAALEVQRQRAP
jgi:hypothetical protein